jgi:hypothetical protein
MIGEIDAPGLLTTWVQAQRRVMGAMPNVVASSR